MEAPMEGTEADDGGGWWGSLGGMASAAAQALKEVTPFIQNSPKPPMKIALLLYPAVRHTSTLVPTSCENVATLT